VILYNTWSGALERRTVFLGGFDLFFPLHQKNKTKYHTKVKNGQNRQKKRFLISEYYII
jgi:hypothetical protein